MNNDTMSYDHHLLHNYYFFGTAFLFRLFPAPVRQPLQVQSTSALVLSTSHCVIVVASTNITMETFRISTSCLEIRTLWNVLSLISSLLHSMRWVGLFKVLISFFQLTLDLGNFFLQGFKGLKNFVGFFNCCGTGVFDFFSCILLSFASVVLK